MTYYYSDPERETDPHALPNIEVFYHKVDKLDLHGATDAGMMESGWYYAFGFPGCMWDSDPEGPFDSEEEALADAREGSE